MNEKKKNFAAKSSRGYHATAHLPKILDVGNFYIVTAFLGKINKFFFFTKSTRLNIVNIEYEQNPAILTTLK